MLLVDVAPEVERAKGRDSQQQSKRKEDRNVCLNNRNKEQIPLIVIGQKVGIAEVLTLTNLRFV